MKPLAYSRETGLLSHADGTVYAGDTRLTFYECRTKGCAFEGVQYQIREALDGRPLFKHAHRCDNLHGCKKLRKRLTRTATLE